LHHANDNFAKAGMLRAPSPRIKAAKRSLASG
jgi:hypothetical protein